MANCITNIIVFKGDSESIQKMLSEISYSDAVQELNSIDFAKIIPVPENIYQGAIGKKEMELYGKNNWRDWNIANWGTSSNAYGCCRCLEYENALHFFTNNTAPHPIIQRLSKMYPYIAVEHKWADEDIGIRCGEREYLNGEITNQYYPEYGKEAVDFACEVIGITPEETGRILNATETDYISSDGEEFDLIEILDNPALFSNSRLTLEEIPKGMYLYHFRSSDDGSNPFSSIEKRVLVNHGGSVVTKTPIDMGEQGYIKLTDETLPNFIGEQITFEKYIKGDFDMDIDEGMGGMQ